MAAPAPKTAQAVSQATDARPPRVHFLAHGASWSLPRALSPILGSPPLLWPHFF